MMHYLNNAGAGLMSDDTLQAMISYYKQEQSLGAYQAARDNKPLLDEFYTSVATIINAASVEEIAFVDSASRGWNLAIYGANIARGDDIITLSTEFGTNLITIYDFATKVGASVHVIQCDDEGDIDLTIMEGLLSTSKNKTMIAVSQAAAQGSIVNPVIEIGHLAKKYCALYIVDGCQSVGQMPVNVQEMNCDAFVNSGRKWLCGPRGTGFLYVRKSAAINPTQLDLASADLILDESFSVQGVKVRTDAKRFEIWERNYAAVVGLTAAMSTIQSIGIDTISQSLSQKANSIRELIVSNRKFQLIGKGDSLSGIVGFYVKDPSMEERVKKVINEKGLTISTMSDWDCPLAFPRNGAETIFRLSPHYFTDSITIDLAREAVETV